MKQELFKRRIKNTQKKKIGDENETGIIKKRKWRIVEEEIIKKRKNKEWIEEENEEGEIKKKKWGRNWRRRN